MGAGGRRFQSPASEKGGSKTGPSPVDRGRAGSKHHLLVDGGGIPLAWTLTGGNRNDVTQLLELLDRVPPVRGRVGRPRRRPRTLIADRGYDHDKYRRLVWQRGVKPLIARRQTEHGSGLGRHRWVVERTFAWLHNRRRLLIRTDRRDDIHEGFLAPPGSSLGSVAHLNLALLDPQVEPGRDGLLGLPRVRALSPR